MLVSSPSRREPRTNGSRCRRRPKLALHCLPTIISPIPLQTPLEMRQVSDKLPSGALGGEGEGQQRYVVGGGCRIYCNVFTAIARVESTNRGTNDACLVTLVSLSQWLELCRLEEPLALPVGRPLILSTTLKTPFS